MFAKLAVVILALGAFGCALLQLRHERLHAASELVRTQLAIRSQDERLWKLRTEIARLVTPEQVRVMAANIGPLRPLVPAVPGGEAFDIRQASLVGPPAPRGEQKPVQKAGAKGAGETRTESGSDPVVFRRERQKPR